MNFKNVFPTPHQIPFPDEREKNLNLHISQILDFDVNGECDESNTYLKS